MIRDTAAAAWQAAGAVARTDAASSGGEGARAAPASAIRCGSIQPPCFHGT